MSGGRRPKRGDLLDDQQLPGPYFAHARYALGYVYLQEGLYEEAIAEINKAITFSGREAESSPELGYARFTDLLLRVGLAP